ncbi:hypothetical protein DNI29_17600 [Hymenobacter sediminis]|uniref:XAC2610-related protein n=1 Tax=Hymenobacter sediminis TaxID=2218621 RepID=UPI000DA6C38E|nr:hypothetical protein [Hymenobacter sediminis]RPD45207.1 hypothetical protein DNI29_17600 [Hymenobacter sediminis]
MTRYLFLLLLLLAAYPLRAQQTYLVDDFSPSYFGKIYIQDTTEVFSPGWIGIYDKKTKKEVVKVESEELALSLHNGRVQSNIQEVPYGEQSLIISEDFNFDGRPDLAIEDGQNSCYHGPSFQIYLNLPTGLKHSQAFTDLAQEYCGMFQVDAKTKRLHTSTKSGCCWHQDSEFIIRNGEPSLVRQVEMDMMRFPFQTTTTTTWSGTRMAQTISQELYLEDESIRVVCSFQVAGNGKQAVLFTTDNDLSLYYALLRKDGQLEFTYPEFGAEADKFTIQVASGITKLRFVNQSAQYTMQQTSGGALSIQVKVGGRVVELREQPGTRKGSLQPLLKMKPENLSHI